MKHEISAITDGLRQMGEQAAQTSQAFERLSIKVHDIMNDIASREVLRQMMGEA